MIPVYQFVTEPGARWISKPNNGGELLPEDVVGELNRLLRERDEARAEADSLRQAAADPTPTPSEAQILRLRMRIHELEQRVCEQGFAIDNHRQAIADAQVGRWI